MTASGSRSASTRFDSFAACCKRSSVNSAPCIGNPGESTGSPLDVRAGGTVNPARARCVKDRIKFVIVGFCDHSVSQSISQTMKRRTNRFCSRHLVLSQRQPTILPFRNRAHRMTEIHRRRVGLRLEIGSHALLMQRSECSTILSKTHRSVHRSTGRRSERSLWRGVDVVGSVVGVGS